MMIFSALLTLHFLHTVVAQEECEKYVQAATTAASNMQSKYFTNNVDYGDQQPWISAVDVFYLGQCTLRSFFAVFSALSSLQWIK